MLFADLIIDVIETVLMSWNPLSEVRCPKCGARAMRIKVSDVKRIWRCRACDHEWSPRGRTRRQELSDGRPER
jgi:ribosomal protein L37AE/L43A